MRNRWYLALLLAAGCAPYELMAPERPQQVTAMPFTEPRARMATRVNYAPASQETSYRVLLIKDKLIGTNPQVGIKPTVLAIGSADPEIFHVGMNQIYVTEGLVRQCRTEGQLAAILAYELGRMIAEREATVSDEVRQPERQLPIQLPIGSNGNRSDRDPTNYIELAKHEKLYPRHPLKLARPDPHLIARDVLDHAGYQRTDLDSAMPLLQSAERFQVLENEFKGTTKQSDWKVP